MHAQQWLITFEVHGVGQNQPRCTRKAIRTKHIFNHSTRIFPYPGVDDIGCCSCCGEVNLKLTMSNNQHKKTKKRWEI